MKPSKLIEARLLRTYLLFDLVSASSAYTVLHLVRKLIVEPTRFGHKVSVKWDERFFLGLLFTAVVFLSISALSGVYRELTRKSRLQQAFNTLSGAVLTALVLFFAIFLDDYVKNYSQYYLTIGAYTSALLLTSGLLRFLLATRVRHRIDRGTLAFPTVLIGAGKEAGDLIASFEKGRSKGYQFLGLLTMEGESIDPRLQNIPLLGTASQLRDIVHDNHVEDVIIALGPGHSEGIGKLVSAIEDQELRIHVLPNLFSILSGQVKMESLGRSLIEVKRELMKPHVAFIKRSFDFVVALLLLLLFSPVLLFSMLMVKLTSTGPVFYLQERLGKNGKPFKIIKLRSMKVDAESAGPQLSSEDDPRITSWGRTMRKYRLDELPQFINVLKGDMGIVGPRPERQFYFNQIIEAAPQYRYLLRVKPGITSWGMVKYGYAENVDEMLERARYDLIYTENITLLNDIKILFYTLVIVLQGRGK